MIVIVKNIFKFSPNYKLIRVLDFRSRSLKYSNFNMKYLNQQEATSIDSELFNDYKFSGERFWIIIVSIVL